MVHAEVTFFVPPSDMRAPLAASEGLRVATRSRGPVTSIRSVSASMIIGWSKARRQKVTGPGWPNGLLTGAQPPTNRRPADPSGTRCYPKTLVFDASTTAPATGESTSAGVAHCVVGGPARGDRGDPGL